MKQLRYKLEVLFTMVMLISGWGIWWLQTSYFPTTTIEAYPFIPLIFYISGVGLIEILYRIDKTNPRKLVNIYMLLKLIKMMFAGLVAVIYLLVLHATMRPFVIIFAIFYMIYLLFETYSFYSVEKQIKKTLE